MNLQQRGEGGLKGFFRTIGAAISDYRKSLLLVVAAIMGFVFVINGGYYVASSKPESCLVCHYMKPHYDTWLNSAHKGVECIACHPGRRTLIDGYMIRYLTGTYHALPFPDVKPDACLACHEEKSLAGEITYKRGIKFNHEHHLGQLRRGKKLRCTSCHATGQAEEHFSVDNEACYLCHFKDADRGRSFTSCNACHGVPQGVIRRAGFEFDHSAYVQPGIECNSCHTLVASGNGDVPTKKCFECHVERVDARKDVNALHRIHITEKGVDCFRCHDRIEHGRIGITPAFELDCNKCHKPQHAPSVEMYVGTGGAGVPSTPSAMFTARVTCEACHASASGASATWSEKKNSCVKCHGEGFDRMLDDWKRDFDRLASETGALLQQTERMAALLPEKASSEREELRKARLNAALVIDGKAAHNPFYGLELARQVASAADQVAAATGSPKPAKPALIASKDGACRTCHSAMPFPESLPFERMNFPHSIHADALDLDCSKCHSSEHHRLRIITKEECMKCHHQEAEIACSHCHYEQNALYTGNFPELGIKGKPDPMSAGGVGCKDCHNLASGKNARADVPAQCEACHDPSYGKMLSGWLNRQDALLAGARTRLDSLEAMTNFAGDPVKRRKAIDEARGLLTFLTKAKSPHNPAQFEKQTLRIDAIINSAGRSIPVADSKGGKQ